jgi:MCM6 C-terminal winged-helix domain
LRTTGKGLDREDLIDWYLEQKEKDINSPEELEYETELIGKVLNKLVKVRNIRSFMSWAFAYPCFTTARITRAHIIFAAGVANVARGKRRRFIRQRNLFFFT